VRHTTAWALGGVLAGTVLLGTGSTMATFSDTESSSATAGAGAVELAVQPVTMGETRMISGEPLTLTVGASSTGPPASLQLTAADAPGSDACGPDTRSVTVSVSADWLPETHPVSLCDLLDRHDPVVLGQVDPTAPISGGVLEVRFDGLGGQLLTSQQWDGTLTFTLVQGVAGFSAAQDVPVHVGARIRSGAAPADEAPGHTQVAESVPPADLGSLENPSDPAHGGPADTPVESAPADQEGGPSAGAVPADAE
jgi:predicted ribosomally synthesized peptide with SipW-like signal peptide